MWTLVAIFAGLGIFLYGMHKLENSLQALGSVRVRKWLGRSTSHPIASVAAGTGITAVLQSSSMVSLIVLAFASSGMIPLFNAVGVILGANLGTTFTGWVVATIGFKMNLDAIALPCFGLGAFVFVFSDQHGKLRQIAGAVMGFGLLVFGLSQMKEAVVDLPSILKPEFLAELSLPLFLLVGVLMTAVIQSSSAMTLVALTALNAGMIDLSSAAALVVGADIGTTSTTALGSLRGPAIAKRLALAHVIYNIVVDAIAFVVLIPLLPQALAWLDIQDPLYGLVLFHSFFNLIGLFIFLPFLKRFSHWLETFFVERQSPITRFIHETPPVVPEAAIKALTNELSCLIAKVIAVNLRNLKLGVSELRVSDEIKQTLRESFPDGVEFDDKYQMTKSLEGEMFYYAAKLRTSAISAGDLKKVKVMVDCARDAVYAMKTLKDVRSNLAQFRQLLAGVNERQHYLAQLQHFYEVLADVIFNAHKDGFRKQKNHYLAQKNQLMHDALHDEIIQWTERNEISSQEMATVFNTNREIWHANRSLNDALAHFCALADNGVVDDELLDDDMPAGERAFKKSIGR